MARRVLFPYEEAADEDEVDVEDGGVARDAAVVDLDEEENEEDGQDEYEIDGFMVDDVDEEEQDEEQKEADCDKEKHKKKKKKKRKRKESKAFVLDEDDYELLQDNNIMGFHRTKASSNNFKRLKKAGRDSEQDGQSGFSYDNDHHKSSRSGWNAEGKLKRYLFGDSEAFEEFAENEEDLEEEDMVEEDEMADFIVDEEVDKTGVLLKTVSRKSCEKKSRDIGGVSQAVLQKSLDIFGDVNALLMRKQDLVTDGSYSTSHAWSVKRLEHEIEPFVVMEKYMTMKDGHIREIDVPERIQLLEEIVDHVPIDDRSIEDESAWIYKQLSTSEVSPFLGNLHCLGEMNKEEIGNVLEMLHVKKLDIPFISMYRKELCLSLLKDSEHVPENDGRVERTCRLKWHKKLWAIQDFDRKWLSLQKRKTALQSYYSKYFEKETQSIDDETKLTLKQQQFKSVMESLKLSESEREVDDVNLKFNLHVPSGEVVAKDRQFKRPTRKSLYTNCYKAGLGEVSCKFGFSPEESRLLLNLEKMCMDELADPEETPHEVAAKFTSAMFSTTEDVLRGARHMAAIAISSEPCIRKYVRSIFMKNATISTNPTSDVDACIDSFHELFGMKWLNEKPLSEFKDAQWLLIQKAEEEKLLHVSIGLPESVRSKLMCDAKECYVSDGAGRSAMLWNDQREMILKEAFFDILLHSMEKEARSLLTTRSKNWLIMEYGKKLWEKVSVAPYWQMGNQAGPMDCVAARVMACCWGIGKPGTTFIMLDSSGEMLDMLHAGSVGVRSQSVSEQQRKKNDEHRLLKFMLDHKPHVVVVGAANVHSVHLKDDIFEIIYNSFKKESRDDGQKMSEITIVFGDESLPCIYENSQVSSDQLSGQPGIVKRAVALGRYLQNPLCMIATLSGPGREILSWKLHKLEHLLTPDEKYGMVEQVMIDATNQVGFDVNLAASHEWLFAPLQFVSGLGPRKSSALQRALVRVGAVFDRKDIARNGIRKKVFINMAGFLRVRRNGFATASGHVIDLLDDTRIHPESYNLAKNMAKDAYDEDAQDQPSVMDEDALELVIERVRNRPKLLKVLDIEEYSKSVEAQLGTRKRETLGDIHMELLSGFQDWRSPYKEPDPEEVFYMISSETKDTLVVGRIVKATVRRVLSERLVCELGSGLTGVIFKEDFLNLGDVDLAEKVLEGSTITCKIKEIQRKRYQVLLTCKESELCNCELQSSVDMDAYNDEEKGRLRIKHAKHCKEKANSQIVPDSVYNEETINPKHKQVFKELTKKLFKPRMIIHPRFQNLSSDETTEYLTSKDPGEFIIHPSIKGPSYLTLTLKVHEGVYSQKEIVEGGKDQKDIKSFLQLGKTLKIGEDTFDNLDEVIDRYVDPLVTYLKAMLGYHKFRSGSKVEIDELLKLEKKEHPMKIVYCFHVSYHYPGYFILSYMRAMNPHHEYIGLSHNGFKFQEHIFAGNNSIRKLVEHLQRHIGSIRSSAAMVPMEGADPKGTGVCSSTGNNGSWNVGGSGATAQSPKNRESRDWGSKRVGSKNGSGWGGTNRVGKGGDDKVWGSSKGSCNEDSGDKGRGNDSWGVSEDGDNGCKGCWGCNSVDRSSWSDRNNGGKGIWGGGSNSGWGVNPPNGNDSHNFSQGDGNPIDGVDRHSADHGGDKSNRSYGGWGFGHCGRESGGWDDGGSNGGGDDGGSGDRGGRGHGQGRDHNWSSGGSSSGRGGGNGRVGQEHGSGRSYNWSGGGSSEVGDRGRGSSRGNGSWSRGGGSGRGNNAGGWSNAGGSNGWGGGTSGNSGGGWSEGGGSTSGWGKKTVGSGSGNNAGGWRNTGGSDGWGGGFSNRSSGGWKGGRGAGNRDGEWGC